MLGVASLDQLLGLFRGQGVRTAYVKLLSPKQDNEKNQIYLGGGLDGVTNLFPARIEVRSASASVSKRKSAAGKPKLEAQIDFAWLGGNGARYNAPKTRIIDYFQYPEVRMSGFLAGCEGGPDALRRRMLGEFAQHRAKPVSVTDALNRGRHAVCRERIDRRRTRTCAGRRTQRCFCGPFSR